MAGIRPVGLYGHDVEAVLLDQPLGDGGAGSIEIAGAMTGFTDHHDSRIGIAIEHLTKGRRVQFRQRLGVLAQKLRDGGRVDAPGRARKCVQQVLRGCIHDRHPLTVG